MSEQATGMADPLAATERAKYERVWAESKLYREHSPGLRLAAEVLPWFHQVTAGHDDPSLHDFGCGDGRALCWFAANGVESVVGTDIAPPVAGITGKVAFQPIHTWTLWEPIPAEWHADFAYCVDVLEHIPTEKVEDVLANILDATRLGGFFQIALFEDTAGSQGDWGPLHLTVEPAGWWIEILSLNGYTNLRTESDNKRLKVWWTK